MMKSDLRRVPGAGERARSSASAKSLRWVITLVMVGAAFLTGFTLAGQPVRGGPPGPNGAPVPRPERQPSDTIGIIDFYGLRAVTEAQVRKALAIQEGDPAPQTAGEITAAVQRLEKAPGVEHAQLARVCCDERGRSILYIGIAEKGAPRFTYHAAPAGRASLPPEMVDTSHRFDEALGEAVQK